MNKFLLSLMILLLVGCGSVEKIKIQEVPVYKVRTVYVTVPEQFLKINVIPTPPNKTAYIEASVEDREELLINYSQSLITELKLCVADKKSITATITEKMKDTPVNLIIKEPD